MQSTICLVYSVLMKFLCAYTTAVIHGKLTKNVITKKIVVFSSLYCYISSKTAYVYSKGLVFESFIGLVVYIEAHGVPRSFWIFDIFNLEPK